MDIRAAEISAILKSQIASFGVEADVSDVGQVLSVGDGIARVSGLPDAAVNELLEFEDGSVGLALNLDESSIGAVVLGDVDNIEEGQTVCRLVYEPLSLVPDALYGARGSGSHYQAQGLQLAKHFLPITGGESA